FRGGRLAQVSEDHSLARQLIERGFISEDDNKASKYRNVLTRAVGMQENIELSTHDIALENGDIVLACSDGLTNMLSDAAIAAVLSKAISLEEQASELIQSANEAGGLDNISVILIRYRRLPTILSRLLGQ
ncbi:MAG TPA: SpoIIE family protein phosphatase, partial [Gammaproteobacteria bacterium]|nr:SpoIIE family protein phosphatase [Gammaproteobacteria bacterium]